MNALNATEFYTLKCLKWKVLLSVFSIKEKYSKKIISESLRQTLLMCLASPMGKVSRRRQRPNQKKKKRKENPEMVLPTSATCETDFIIIEPP